MHNFKIKGYIDDEFGYNVEALERELSAANGDDLFIEIDSVGGNVHTGLALFVELRRYAKENNATITTRSSGYVASIATAVFLAGDVRIVNEFMQPFIHEPYIGYSDAQTADEFKKNARNLEDTKNIMADFYSKNTLMTKEQALDIMANDTWLSADECLALGFATEIEELSKTAAKMVAKLKLNVNQKEKKMSKQKKAWWTRFAMLKETPKAELELAGVDGDAIVFPELEEDDAPSEGARVTVGDDANYTGEAETEGYIFVIEDGVLVSFVDKTEIVESEVIEDLLDIIDEKDKQLQEANAELTKVKKLYNSLGKEAKDPAPRSGKKEDPAPVNKVQEAMAIINERRKNNK